MALRLTSEIELGYNKPNSSILQDTFPSRLWEEKGLYEDPRSSKRCIGCLTQIRASLDLFIFPLKINSPLLFYTG